MSELELHAVDAGDRARMHAGGTVAWRAYLDGRWVGWIGDGRAWQGHGYGARKWWAAWREDGDDAARANTEGATLPTKTSAVQWLTWQARR